ncbi:MAG: hypothetical protein ABFD69_03140 [Candidatus Sumerlaeia bacterium]
MSFLARIITRAQDWFRITLRKASGDFLCDTCQYDHGHVCRRPERPNAIKCSDYRGK